MAIYTYFLLFHLSLMTVFPDQAFGENVYFPKGGTGNVRLRMKPGDDIFELHIQKPRGIVDVRVEGEWGSLCAEAEGFSENNGKVVCRQLGYAGLHRTYYSVNPYSTPYDIRLAPYLDGIRFENVFYVGLNCNGLETSLSQCPYRQKSGSDADCYIRYPPYLRNMKTNETYHQPAGFFFAGVVCDKADEDSGERNIRLTMTPGDDLFELHVDKPRGEVEVHVDGEWGPLCAEAEGFSENNGKVVCRQLGYAGLHRTYFSHIPYSTPYNDIHLAAYLDGIRFGNVFYVGLNCNGWETSLSQCPYRQRRGSEADCYISDPPYLRNMLTNETYQSKGFFFAAVVCNIGDRIDDSADRAGDHITDEDSNESTTSIDNIDDENNDGNKPDNISTDIISSINDDRADSIDDVDRADGIDDVNSTESIGDVDKADSIDDGTDKRIFDEVDDRFDVKTSDNVDDDNADGETDKINDSKSGLIDNENKSGIGHMGWFLVSLAIAFVVLVSITITARICRRRSANRQTNQCTVRTLNNVQGVEFYNFI